MVPAVTLGGPDHLSSAVEGARDQHRGADQRPAGLVDDVAADAGRRIDVAQPDVRVAALDLAVLERACCRRSIDARSAVIELGQRPRRDDVCLRFATSNTTSFEVGSSKSTGSG